MFVVALLVCRLLGIVSAHSQRKHYPFLLVRQQCIASNHTRCWHFSYRRNADKLVAWPKQANVLQQKLFNGAQHVLNLTFYLGGLELYKYSSDSSLGHVEVTLPYLNEIEIHLLNSDSMAVVIKKNKWRRWRRTGTPLWSRYDVCCVLNRSLPCQTSWPLSTLHRSETVDTCMSPTCVAPPCFGNRASGTALNGRPGCRCCHGYGGEPVVSRPSDCLTRISTLSSVYPCGAGVRESGPVARSVRWC